jgi:putative transposase
VLGLWVGTGGEGAKHWMGVLAELKNRGVGDVCIACCDGLKGLPEAINQIWLQASVQQCVVHLVRASLRYASKGHWSQITKHLRQIYTAPTVDAAEARFADFEQTWGEKYPAIIRTLGSLIWSRCSSNAPRTGRHCPRSMRCGAAIGLDSSSAVA